MKKLFNSARWMVVSAGAAVTSLASPTLAANSSSGTIAVALNVTNACIVNGASAYQANLGSLGTIQFPDQPGIFGNVDGELVSALGTLQVQCSPNVTPMLTLGSGAHDAAGKRYMASSGNSVTYRLFSDSARTNEVTIGGQIALGTTSTTPISVPIYARVNSGGQVLPAGTYTDTVQVTLTW
jgi:spore coat protein U-like protein